MVRLADGRLVARTAEELAALPPNLRGSVVPSPPADETK